MADRIAKDMPITPDKEASRRRQLSRAKYLHPWYIPEDEPLFPDMSIPPQYVIPSARPPAYQADWYQDVDLWDQFAMDPRMAAPSPYRGVDVPMQLAPGQLGQMQQARMTDWEKLKAQLMAMMPWYQKPLNYVAPGYSPRIY